MFLSDRDIRLALATGQLIVHPAPTEIDTLPPIQNHSFFSTIYTS
jgi:hypothetical protein